ncbi:unnamed protein product [Porites lobata]|uniref:NACHT domain-containing protein n=1 Tax=Porites lobata TaxID=104759 RepID=A0ABN8RMQ2_9CNID|nr:unnamed protein product [Porites lobata]
MATAAPSPLASSPAKTNGNKLSRLLIDGGTTVLRNVFDRYHPPANLASGLNTNYSILNNLLRRRVLNGHQWDKLFPPGGGVPDSNTFDITLLFLLLTTICGLSPPLTGWHTKPFPGDNSLEANLARVKFFRNELYGHVTSSGVEATSFSTFWHEISTALICLGLDQAEIDRLKAEQGGEEDYLDALTEWAGSDEDIKAQLKDIHQRQLKLSETQCKTQDVAEEVLRVELKGEKILLDSKSKLDEVSQLVYATHQATNEAHQENILRLDKVCDSQSKTIHAVDVIHESIQEVKQEVKGLTKRKNEHADEVLKTLVKSEFKGDIEFHANKFQEGTREWIFKSIKDWLDDRSSPHRVIVISGNPGMGKTVISAVVSQRMQRVGGMSGSHFFQHNNSRYRDPRLMLQSLACHLCQAMPSYKDALVEQLSRNLGKDLNNMGVEELFALLFKEPLSTVQDPGRNTLIVIDGLDESEYQGRNELLHVISNHFSMLPVWIRILITTRPERSITEVLRHLEPIELKQKREENLNDIQTLFENQLSNKIGEEHKDIILKELVKKSEGLFIYAYYIVDFIQKNVSILTPDQVESVLPSGISSVYLSYFKRLENELCKELNADEEHFLRFLCALAAAREPLPVEFIAKILNPGGKSLTAQRKVKKAISCISTLLPVREDRLHFFHKSIKDWLIASLSYEQHDFAVDEKEGHYVLSDLCVSELDSLQRKGVHDRQFKNTESCALHHGTQHMLQVVNDHDCADETRAISVTAEQVYKYATDLELVYAKLKVKSTSATEDLLSLHSQNCSLLSDERDFVVTSLLSLLKKHSYILVDHPRLLFQCLINEGIPELSSSAAVILESSTPKIPYMKHLKNEDQRRADKARFYCSDKIVCFDVSPEMDYLICECRDGTICLWSLLTGNKIWVRPTLTKKEFYSGYPDDSAYRVVGNNSLSYYRSVTFHPNGESVLAGTLQFVYTLDGDTKDLFPSSDSIFSNFVFCKDKKEVLTDRPNKPKEVALWNIVNGENVLNIVADEEIATFTISEDGSQVAFSQVTFEIVFFDRVNESVQRILQTESVVCGLMHFTPDTENRDTLVCGFLGFTVEEECGTYKGCFCGLSQFLTFNSDLDFDSVQPETFSLWPYDSSGTLDWDFGYWDLTMQDISDCWVHCVIPSKFLYAGSYIRLNKESALAGSPACKYVAMVNTEEVFRLQNGGVVVKIAFSLEGDAIYSITSESESLHHNLTLTVFRMSNNELLSTKIFPGPISIFPTRDGVMLRKHDRVAELWSFDMSTCLRSLPNVTAYNIVSSTSEEFIAGCYKVALFELSKDLANEGSDNSEDWPDDIHKWCVDFQVYWVIDVLDVTSAGSRIVSSLKADLDADEVILSVLCIDPSQVLLCTSKEEDFGGHSLENVKLKLRKNGLILLERTTCWIDPDRIIASHLLCSPRNEFVVTWNTLDQGHGLHILNAYTGETLHVFLGEQNDIVDCKFLDDESVVCCSEDNFLRLYNIRTGDLLSILDIGEQPFCLGACLYQPLVAIGLSATRIKFVHVQLPKETKKTARLSHQTPVN